MVFQFGGYAYMHRHAFDAPAHCTCPPGWLTSGGMLLVMSRASLNVYVLIQQFVIHVRAQEVVNNAIARYHPMAVCDQFSMFKL